MGVYEELFAFAAKAGSLEGYLYEREAVEPLEDWVRNIERMYTSLPDSIKEDVRDEFREVLNRTLTYGERVLDRKLRTRLNNLLSEL